MFNCLIDSCPKLMMLALQWGLVMCNRVNVTTKGPNALHKVIIIKVERKMLCGTYICLYHVFTSDPKEMSVCNQNKCIHRKAVMSASYLTGIFVSSKQRKSKRRNHSWGQSRVLSGFKLDSYICAYSIVFESQNIGLRSSLKYLHTRRNFFEYDGRVLREQCNFWVWKQKVFLTKKKKKIYLIKYSNKPSFIVIKQLIQISKNLMGD